MHRIEGLVIHINRHSTCFIFQVLYGLKIVYRFYAIYLKEEIVGQKLMTLTSARHTLRSDQTLYRLAYLQVAPYFNFYLFFKVFISGKKVKGK